MDTTCIITGIILVSPDRDEWVAGDLFIQDETLIVNARTKRDGYDEEVTAWRSDWEYKPDAKTLQLSTEFFERRGVFVVNREDCELSHEAVAYVMKQFASMGPWKKGA